MTRSQLETQVRKFCANMIYIFIPDTTLSSGVFGKHTNAIYNKRSKQIRYITGLSTEAGMAGSLDTIREWIRDEIANTYAPLYNPNTKRNETATPELILYHLAQGDEINGINWSAGVYGIGSTKTVEFGSGITVNQNGTFSLNGTELPTASERYDTIYTWKKNGTLKTAALYDKETKQTYTAKNSKKGWYAYSNADAAGNVTKVKSTTKLSASDLDLWENINNILGNIQDILSTFAAWLSGETSQSLSPSQLADGWMEDASTAEVDWSTLLLVGAGALAVGAVVGGGKKTKSKTTSKTKEY